MDPSSAGVGRPPIPGHVPVEHRFLGLDRRTIPLALIVLAVMVLMISIVPAIDGAVGWDDEIEAGDTISLGGGVTFVPPVGWELTQGIRLGDEPRTGVSSTEATAALANGDASVTVVRSGFDGTAEELLAQVNRLRDASDADPDRLFEVTGPPTTVTTASGITGISEAYTSAAGEGRVLAFTIDGPDGPSGIAITVDGTDTGLAAVNDDVDALVDSLTADEAGR